MKNEPYKVRSQKRFFCLKNLTESIYFSLSSFLSFKLSLERIQHALILVCFFLFGVQNSSFAQCNYNLPFGTGIPVNQMTMVTPPPYTTSFGTVPAPLASAATVQSNMNITICFYGDMDAANETFDVVISGQTFSSGGFGMVTTIGSPVCVPFIVTPANTEADIQPDGDVDITYNNFGAGWDNSGGESFNAQVQSATFTYDLNLGLAASSMMECQDGTDITFTTAINPTVFAGTSTITIAPATGGFSPTPAILPTGGTLDVSAADEDMYAVTYSYTTNGCTFEETISVEVFEIPNATLQETVLDCRDVGDIVNLQSMFDGADLGGTFTAPGLTINGNEATVPAGGGCFMVTYEALNPNNCSNAPYQDTEELLITTSVNPSFTVTSATPSPACSDGGMVAVTVTNTSNGPTPELTLESNQGGGPAPASFGTVNLQAPAAAGSTTYRFCYTETSGAPAAACGAVTGMDCSRQVCQTFTVYNDGIECGANSPFMSECPVGDDAGFDPCNIETSPDLRLGCFGLELNIVDLVDATLEARQSVITCEDEDVKVDYEGTFAGLSGLGAGGPTLGSLPGAEIVCDIFGFKLPIVCIEPLGALTDFCDEPLITIISTGLAALAGGDGGGGLVVADTDGDGAFDMVLKDYGFGQAGEICVPNNVDGGQGTIIVRNVIGFPFKPKDACGDPIGEEVNLLDLLPIDFIPVAGPIINQALTSASCDIPLVFSDEATVEIFVQNTSEPVFVNCNENGYVFAEDLSCNIEANWSIPLAQDGCTDNNLIYKGRTAGTSDTHFDITFGNMPPPIVDPSTSGSGVYQTGGPVIGSNLPPGTYTVVYTAFSCAGVSTTCEFDVVVTTGTPVLACPNDMTINNDVDECEAVVTGLAAIRGIGCSTIINYSIDFPASATGFPDVMTNTPYSMLNLGTHHDPSGISFPYGTTTVTYTMMVDINGDGDVDGPGETQTCDFDITIIDEQKPTEICVDVTVRLDNTGNVTVFAVDPSTGEAFVDGGSFDNCDTDPEIVVSKPGETFGPFVSYDCTDVGGNLVTLQVTDMDDNVSTCIAAIIVEDFYEEVQMFLDAPELCLEANNPVQLDFSNYLTITLPDGTVINHHDVMNNTFLGDTEGGFGITAFLPHPGSTGTPGTITTDGVYTPGTGTGFVTVSYVMALPDAVNTIPQNGNIAFMECFIIVHETFELRQPLDMGDPSCECGDAEMRTVELGILTGGLEPYTIQYDGARLDVNNDGFADDDDGQYVYDVAKGHSIDDFMEDLGAVLVEYTQPTWSIAIVDARGCEIFRSGSCDNDDLTEGPQITCPTPPAMPLETENLACEQHWAWEHPLPSDNCKVIIYTYRIINPDGSIEGPFDLEPLLNILPPAPSNPLFDANYEFEEGTTIVEYYAEDAVGNYIECDFEVEVVDPIAPIFINCPYPPIVENAETNHCDAYINFALPLAEDNCSIPVVTQIDNTGLEVGDRFPVGTTILYYQAEDLSGNTDTCQVKVVVNDFWVVPDITCPVDVVQATDPWRCDAEVNGLAPTISSICQDNLSLVYEIFSDEALTDRVECGVSDASGQTFEKGDSWVRYTVQNQPLLLISEISQSGATDQLEITNLGAAAIEISCLEIARLTDSPATTETLPAITMLPSLAPTVLGVGQVMVFDFTANTAVTTPACYTISYMGVTFDEVAVNGMAGCNGFTGLLTSGDVARNCEADSNDAADWREAELCFPLTIGALNPNLEAMTDNGTQTSLQNILPHKNTCVVKVTVADEENPFCGELAPAEDTNAGGGIPVVSTTTCNRSTLNIATDCIIGLLNFDLNGTVTPANSTITLISPEGTEVVVTALPFNTNDFFLEKSTGDWILDVVPNAGVGPFAVTDWNVNITCLLPFDEPNANINNEPGQCGASFTWNHPFFADNCFEGTLTVDYSTTDAACTPPDGPIGNDPNGILPGLGGFEVTEFFCVGTTMVTYTLTDLTGNVHECSFDVTVADVENPVVVCPDDIIVNLNGGECRAPVCFAPISATDNCAVVDTISTPASCSDFEIGITQVIIQIVDAAGNIDECMFNVIVNEFVPASNELACNDLIQISLDATCTAEILPDMVLEGDNYGCYEDYIIVITDGLATLPTSPFVGLDDVGNTYIVTVTDPDTGNSCWSEITIEDKLNPEIECPADLTIFCNESKFPANTGSPTLLSCESSIETQFNDIFSDNGNCDQIRGVLERTWTVTDESGNSTSCQQIITMKRLAISDITFPPSYDGISQPVFDCTTVADNPQATNQSNTGVPTVNGASILNQAYCGISINVSEETYPTCTGSYDILRTFSIYDPCLPATPGINPFTYIQVIKVLDNTAPLLICPVDYTVSTNAGTSCLATEFIASASVTDNCSPFEVHTDLPTGTVLTNGGMASDMELGTYLITYYAYDDCGNLATCSFNLTVADLAPPTVVCDEITTVDLSSDGLAVVYAETFDDGTYDDCCLDRLEARRMTDACNILGNTTFDNDGHPNDNNNDPDDGEFVTFCCDDIDEDGNSIPVMVVLRAYDCEGNMNECMVEVLVEDKLAPTITCPENRTITCDEYTDLFAVPFTVCENADAEVQSNCQSGIMTAAGFGQPFAFDNCEVNIDTTVTITNSQCGVTAISREYTVVDNSGNGGFGTGRCEQIITVEHVSDWVVEFPEDKEGFCNEPDPTFGEPEIYFETCELIAISYEDQLYNIVPDACFKIVRQWTVINWCVVGIDIDQEPNAIELSEEDLGEDLNDDDETNDRTFRDSYTGNVNTQDNDPDADNYDGFITYQQTIKVIDVDAPVIDEGFTVQDFCIIEGDGNVCTVDILLPTPDYDDCILNVDAVDAEGNSIINALDITAEVFDEAGTFITNSFNVNGLVAGTYTVRYTAIDHCGNTTAKDFSFDVNDCKYPTPYCKEGIILELMAVTDPNNTSFEPMVELWATDMDAGSFDNCSGDLTLSFSSDMTDIVNVYTCDGTFANGTFSDGGVGENLIELWVTDAAGLQDFCVTSVTIQANQAQCNGGDPLVSTGGNITTEEAVNVQEVNVNINGNGIGVMSSFTTGTDGNFDMSVPAGGDYTVVPEKNINPMNGVTTFDLVKISKHILNVQLLDSPYKMIAGDINNSGSLTTLDLVKLRKMILLIDTEFSSNNSWRFVDKDYQFPNPQNPWTEDFPEVINLNNLGTNQSALDFVAIKIGDVNNNANVNELLGSDDRTFDGKMNILVADQTVKIGQKVTVDFNINDFNHFGYQFTLGFENLEFVDLENGLAIAENFGLHLLEEGVLTTSWHNAEGQQSDRETLFSLTFVAEANGQLSDFLSIQPAYTKAEAYAMNGDLQSVQLNFNNTSVTEKFELYQNFPNPFDDQTAIRFYLPIAENGTLTISDIDGKVIQVIQQDFQQGTNEINISRENLGGNGVFYYQLNTPNHTATKRMVFIGK